MTETCFSSIADSKVSADGVIAGVAVITVGEALGHGVFIDSTTLEMFSALGVAFPSGVQVKIDHGSGFSSIVGTLKNFSVQGNKVVADLHLLQTHKEYSTIVEMADKMPNAFGLSVSFSGKRVELDGKQYVRTLELYSIDLVDHPAANPSGLFSVDSKPFTKTMIQELQALWKKLGETITSLSATPEPAELTAVKTDLTALGEKISAELTVALAAKTELEGKVVSLSASLEVAQNEAKVAAIQLSSAKEAVEKGFTEFKLEAKPEATLADNIIALQSATHTVLSGKGMDGASIPSGTAPAAKPLTITEKCLAANKK